MSSDFLIKYCMLKLLDLFCGAGGAAKGYYDAGYLDITGVDIEPQKNYPYKFKQADALTIDLSGYDLIHASPPCQQHSKLSATKQVNHNSGWMLQAIYDRLESSGIPWVIENVQTAQMPNATSQIVLCGSMFGLKVRRHRKFISSEMLLQPKCDHKSQGLTVDVTGHSISGRSYKIYKQHGLAIPNEQDKRDAMGIQWMSNDELAQAIPPAYTEFIGRQISGI